MRRRRFLLASLAGALAAPLVASAQQAGKVPRVGVLLLADSAQSVADAFQQGLRERGYVDGQSIDIEYRSAECRVAGRFLCRF